MGKQVNFVTSLHEATTRDYLGRMLDDKAHCMTKAKEYGFDYWDGERRYGYGGYRYIPGYWTPVAQSLIEKYSLTNESSVLDIGCGKAFLLYELSQLLPGLTIAGLDVSRYGLSNAKKEIRANLFLHRAQDPLPFDNHQFDLAISLACLHNLEIFEIFSALREIERVTKQGYVMVESYRNEQELFNLQCWALTCESFFSKEEWIGIYNYLGYSGDYEFIFF